MTMFSHLIVGWDGSDLSERAVNVAAEVAQRFGARLEIVEIIEPVPHRGPDRAERDAERAAQIDRARSPLERCKRRGVEATFRLAEGNDIAQALAAEAHRSGADLLVLGHPASGGLERRLAGDVAERVIRTATIPILVVGDQSRT
jgi:nucleotide-binding universal stress UspA family protein